MNAPVRRTTAEENILLTSTGKGTPMGELLRRYWWPIGVTADLQDKPTMVRLLGEDLVLFRDRQNRLGLIDALCPHRRANLALGTTNAQGLRCRYHGWLFNTEGKVLDVPCDVTGLKDRIKQKAYPVQELGGLIFAYLGPLPAPLLPRFDFLVMDGVRHARVTGFSECNWLQAVENGLDPLHASFAHGSAWAGAEPLPIYMDSDDTEFGVVYKSLRTTAIPGRYAYREQQCLMPGIANAPDGIGRTMKSFENYRGDYMDLPRSVRFNTPIDDTHTMVVRIVWKPASSPAEWIETPLTFPDWSPTNVEPYGELKRMENTPKLGYEWPTSIGGQDATIQDSMGAIVDRENENLYQADNAVIRLRNLLLRSLEDVKQGRDPHGTVRDKSRNDVIPIPVFEKLVTKDEFEQISSTRIAAE